MTTIRCPNCAKSYHVKEEMVGRAARCRSCGETITVQIANDETDAGVERRQSSRRAAASQTGADSEHELPEKLGRFRIRGFLGSGAFGVVYRAHDPVLERDVALKVPQAFALQSEEAAARFLREPKAAAQLRHPNIVPVYDAGFDGNRFYVASAFIAGSTLADTMEQRRMATRQAAETVLKLASGLHYAHRQGIVHRDVKPANVMLDEQGEPHLMDFGLAQWEQTEEKVTRDGSVIGTPAYMSPEQAGAPVGGVGPQSDQYSLGVMLYELLCGQRPFSSNESVAALLYQIREKQPASPKTHNPQLSRDLETICLKALAKEPTARYEDCGQLSDDLRRWLEGEPIRARRMGVVEQTVRWARRNRALASLTSAVALLLLLVAVLATVASVRISGALATAEDAFAREQDARLESEQERQRAENALEEARRAQNRAEANLAEAKRQEELALHAQLEEKSQRLIAVGATEDAQQARTRLEESLAAAVELRTQADGLRQQAENRERTTRRLLYGVEMKLAMEAYEARQWDRMNQLLTDYEPRPGIEDLRTFEWYYLAGQSSQPAAGALARALHQGAPVYRLHFSRGAETLISFAQDMSVKFSDLLSGGEPMGAITFDEATINAERERPNANSDVPLRDAFCLSDDANVLVTARRCVGQPRLWIMNPRKEVNFDTKDAMFSFRGPVALHPDGEIIALVKIVNGFRLKKSLVSPAAKIVREQLKAKRQPIAETSRNFQQLVLRQLAQLVRQRLEMEGMGAVASDMLALQSPALESSPFFSIVALLDRRTGKVGIGTPFHSRACDSKSLNPVRLLRFSPDGERLAMAYVQKDVTTVALWDIQSQTQLPLDSNAELSPFDRWAFSPNGKRFVWLHFDRRQRLLSALASPSVRVFNAEYGQPDSQFQGPPGGNAAAFSLDDKLLAIWRGLSYRSTREEQWDQEKEVGKSVSLWNAESGKVQRTLEGHKFVVRALAFSPDKTTVATASEDRTVRLWDLTTGLERVSFRDHNDKVLSVAFSSDGGILASGDAQGAIRVRSARLSATVQLRSLKSAPDPVYKFVPELGLHVELDPTLLERKARATVRILEVREDTPARRAGIARDDLILSVNGERVAKPVELLEILLRNPELNEFRILADRGGRELERLLIINDAVRQAIQSELNEEAAATPTSQ